MSLKPLHDWAVIVPAEDDQRTSGGLYIPDTAREKPERGVVEAIGPGAFEAEKMIKKSGEKKERRFIPTVVKPGERVLFARYAGKTYTINGEERILVRERDILGIVIENPSQIESRQRPLQIPASTATTSAEVAKTTPTVALAASRGEKRAVTKSRQKGAKKSTAKKKVKKKAVKKQTARAKKGMAKPVKKALKRKKPASKKKR